MYTLSVISAAAVCLSLLVTRAISLPAVTINASLSKSACWSLYSGVCVKTGSDGCPFTDAWFSWLHCPTGYHCCVPPKRAVPDIERHPIVTCGNRSRADVADASLIVGGGLAERRDWPWLAQILVRRGTDTDNEPPGHHCGGALIHPQWILSAGHCFAWADPGDTFSVRLGHTAESDAQNLQAFNVSRIVVHEKFFQPIYSNDIALVRLDRPANVGELTYPLCLPEPGETFANTVGSVAGWGGTDDSETSDLLLETQLPLVSYEKCKEMYADTNRPVYPENICAGYLAGGRDACGGDSGGPLVTKRHGLWLAAGLVSHGDGCGQARRPGVYTGVAFFADWVRRIVAAGR